MLDLVLEFFIKLNDSKQLF